MSVDMAAPTVEARLRAASAMAGSLRCGMAATKKNPPAVASAWPSMFTFSPP